ncbi:hypothetical protein TCAL_02513 [Tigriopus californicus]|uniref:Urea transporter n=1 Tax=Tigriopus californicus TaxID=6832 RepID=A0A553NUM7_TIGCA|nr:hypothetical protein TCAL_02513 [Tigriopus californicus]
MSRVRRRTSQNPWNTFLGDCSVVDAYLMDKPILSLWFPLHYLNVFLRAVGQPTFVNNPFCGAIIFASLFIQDYIVGLGCLLGGSVATIGELILRLQPFDLLRNGVAAFNGVLVGTVISVLYPGFYQTYRTPEMWIFIVVGSLLSAFGNFLGRFNLPYLALPFNMIIVCSFLTIQPPLDVDALVGDENGSYLTMTGQDNLPVTTTMSPSDDFGHHLANGSSAFEAITNSSENRAQINQVDWMQARIRVGRGALVSMSQVYAVDHVSTSIVMNIATALASPLLFVMCSIGAIIGTFLAAVMFPIEVIEAEVYTGVWGYNALLTMAALSCVFFSFNHMSFLLGVMATLANVVVQCALKRNMTETNNIPVFTVPMTLVTLVFLLTTDVRGVLHRVVDPSYPEKQSYQWFRESRQIPQSIA